MNITVFGSGTWGSALAQVLSDNGHKPLIYGISHDQVDDINNNHKNTFFFGPDVSLSKEIKATTKLEEAVAYSDIFLLSVPSIAIRGLLEQIVKLLDKKVLIINTAKGFDTEKRSTLK